jgi:hypothetical protein
VLPHTSEAELVSTLKTLVPRLDPDLQGIHDTHTTEGTDTVAGTDPALEWLVGFNLDRP